MYLFVNSCVPTNVFNMFMVEAWLGNVRQGMTVCGLCFIGVQWKLRGRVSYLTASHGFQVQFSECIKAAHKIRLLIVMKACAVLRTLKNQSI